jgi:hypothetical protein
VALQGTLETFSLPDVLALLSATKKTGCLRVQGDRGEGSIWVADGSLVASTASGAPNADGPVEVVFELLRFDEGEFVFDDGDAPEDPGDPADATSVLEDAAKLLEEWEEVAAVVPSSAHWVQLSEALGADEVTISREDWTALVAVAGGRSVAEFGTRLELDEMPAVRRVKDLCDAGLVEVTEPRSDASEVAQPAAAEPEPEPQPEPEPEPEPEPVEEEEHLVAAAADDGAALADDDVDPFDPDGLVIDPDSAIVPPSMVAVPDDDGAEEPEPAEMSAIAEPAPAATAIAPEPEPEPAESEPGEAAEIARQLANLSPKAARAVAAAAKASTPEERDAALAEVEESDEQINRDLLLKFLGSVN